VGVAGELVSNIHEVYNVRLYFAPDVYDETAVSVYIIITIT